MVSVVNISSMDSNSLSSNLNGFTFKQFKRSYPGNYSINFSHSLSSFNDFNIKNYTNFYLTNDYKIKDIFEFDHTPLKASSIYTPILWGTEYLSFSDIDPEPYALTNRYHESKNYGIASISDTKLSLSIDILDNNICNIYHTKDYQKFFLVVDDTNSLVFVKQNLLSTDPEVIKPQDFHYLFSEYGNLFYLFKRTQTETNIITVSDGELLITPILDNNLSYANWFFKIEKSIYTYPTTNLNTSFITYDTNNMLNYDKCDFELSNNLLLHKKIANSATTDVIVLKNQLLQNNIYSSSNNLLSGFNKNIFVNELREYTSIGNTMDSETSEALELNYVFYNKPYKIIPGSNIFYSPSSIAPYTQLNINDTKFIESGAFSYETPEFADKVYHLSNDINNYDNGQHLLCTWLSGSPFRDNSVWVDRYYYPDLIEKSEALAASSILSITYDDYIEVLVNSNSQKKDDIRIQKFFDKKSDLSFIPNQKYNYERISKIESISLSSNYSYCQTLSTHPTNYFKEINKSGEVSIAFTFSGDDSNWMIQSDRGYIDSGISISKINNSLTIICKFYDATTRDFNGGWFNFSKTLDIKSLKTNNLCISMDVKLGIGYFFFNNEIVYDFRLPQYQLLGKNIINGDFKYISDITYDLISDKINGISNIFVNDLYISPEKAFLIFTINSGKIDDIYITLPCGLRNSIDDIAYLNSACGSSTFKSNYIDIELKNIGITDDIILDDLKTLISGLGDTHLPASTTINSITFRDYKKGNSELVDASELNPLIYNGILITYNGNNIIITP